MGSMLPYIAYMDPMGNIETYYASRVLSSKEWDGKVATRVVSE